MVSIETEKGSSQKTYNAQEEDRQRDLEEQ